MAIDALCGLPLRVASTLKQFAYQYPVVDCEKGKKKATGILQNTYIESMFPTSSSSSCSREVDSHISYAHHRTGNSLLVADTSACHG